MKKIILVSFLTLLFSGNTNAQCVITNLQDANGNYIPLNYECPYAGFNLSGTYNGVVYSGDAWLKPAAGNTLGQLRKPLIFVEGLDLDTEHHDTHRHGSRGWPNFISGIASETDPSEIIFDHLPILISELHNRGYDIFYLDFYDGTTYMQGNAMVLVDLIQKITLNYAGPDNHSIVVAGASMGGQIAKYALSYMEKNNIKHCVGEYISIDSPHQGANIPMGMMQMLEQIAPLSDELQKYKDYLYSPAPMQLLINHSYSGAAGYRQSWLSDLAALGNYPKFCRKVAITNGSKTADELFSAGNQLADFQVNSLSPCNGNNFIRCKIHSNSGVGTPSFVYQGKFLKGANILEMLTNIGLCEGQCIACIADPTLFYDFKLFAVPLTTPAYDNAPGGKRNSLVQFGQKIDRSIGALIQNNTSLNWSINSYVKSVNENYHCFIPTISGLDINTTDLLYNVNSNLPDQTRPYPSIFPFDAYYAPSGNNEFHVEITGDATQGNIQWTLNELSKSDMRLTNTLNSSSPNNGTFNFGRRENRFIKYLYIGAGGNLYVNGNIPSDFGSATTPPIPGGTSVPDPGSSLTVETCFCDNSRIEVLNNGKIILGDNSNGNIGNLIFHSGTQLILRSGSTIKINEGSKLTIEPGANLIMEDNVTILLEGPNALFDVQGALNQVTINGTNNLSVLRGAATTGGTLKLSTGSINMQSNSHFVVDDCRVLLNDVILSYQQDADFTLNGSNAYIDVPQPCNISIGSGHSMIVKKGADLTGGTLNLNSGLFDLYTNGVLTSDHCKIVLNDYTFNYYHHAQINLNGEEAMLQFGGLINLQSQADLHFSGDGYFGFKLNPIGNGDINIHGDASNSITLIGSGKSDKIAEVVSPTYVKADDQIKMQTMQDGLVEFGNYSSWLMASSYKLKNLMATSIPGHAANSNGFWVCAVPNHEIRDVTFKALNHGLSAYLMWGSANTLRINDCSFEQCYNGLKFVDKGVQLNNLDFVDCNLPIDGINASTTSSFKNVAIYNAGSNYNNAIKLLSSGTAAFYFQNLSISENPYGGYNTGIFLDGPSLTNIKCSSVDALTTSIYLHDNASLNLSPLNYDPATDPLGQNSFSQKFGGNNILRSGGGIDAVSSNLLILQDGFNDLSVDNSNGLNRFALSGSTFSWSWINGERILPAHNNKWDNIDPSVSPPYNTTTGLSLTDLHKGGGGSGNVKVIDYTPNFNSCVNGPTSSETGDYGERGIPLSYCPRCPDINGDNFSYTPMREAIETSLEASVDTINPNSFYDAFNMFNEIMNTLSTYEEDRINWNSEFAYLKMKELFGTLVREDRIVPLDESNEYCIKLIEVEKRMIELSREKDDDFHEFYYTIDLATTLRLIGNYQSALDVLNALAPCLKLDDAQVKFLDNWLASIQAEQLLKTGLIGIFDFDNYAGMNTSNREFKKIGNTQANIDTVVHLSELPPMPINQQFALDNSNFKYSISSRFDSVSVNYHIKKSDWNNNLVWEQDFDGRNKGIDSIKAILIDDNNNLYVTGKSWNGVDFDVLTIKYDTAGNTYWIAKYNDNQIGNDEPLGFEIDSVFHIKVYVHSYNDSIAKYKTIYYSQCDSSCTQNYRIKNSKNEKSKISSDGNLDLIVYPIPAADKLSLVLNSENSSQTFLLNMFDMTGRLVFSKNISYKYVMDLSSLTKGVYQLVVSDHSHSLKQRIVID